VGASIGLVAALATGCVQRVEAQAASPPVLHGTVFVGDTAMSDGTVVLHRLSSEAQAEFDSLALGPGGGFRFALPAPPDPDRDELYFTSVRHQGVLYFGPAITRVEQLDSLYEVHAYDTILAPEEGSGLSIQARNVFFEPDGAAWRVTDLFQVRNDADRTLVSRPGGRVWSHPLPSSARDVVAGEGEPTAGSTSFEDGALVVRAAMPPGERLFVVRYMVDSLAVSIPLSGTVEALDVLVREPAPPLEIPGLELLDRIELEAGSTYLRFAAVNVSASAVRLVPGLEPAPPRVEWVAFMLALVLGAAGLFILRPGGGVGRAPHDGRPGHAGGGAATRDRDALLWDVALLDEEFEARPTYTDGERKEYARHRAELLRRIRALR
jgi:hypothetical protein